MTLPGLSGLIRAATVLVILVNCLLLFSVIQTLVAWGALLLMFFLPPAAQALLF